MTAASKIAPSHIHAIFAHPKIFKFTKYPSILKTLLICLMFPLFIGAQSTDIIGNLYLSGKVVNESNRGMQSKIQVFKKGELINEFETNGIGKFEFAVALQDSMVFAVTSQGYVSKTIWVDTRVTKMKQESDYRFPFFIDLYPLGRIPSNVDLERPVGQILFSGIQFVYDTHFTEEANERLKEYVKERKGLKVRPIEE
jgi:hypothetical protein